MERSQEITELVAALAIAQGVIEGAAKDSANPFFKSSYADLASVWQAIRAPLSANGLAVMQLPSADGQIVTITTILTHKSGQWISSDLTITAKEDSPQAVGSAITYARRYALQSVVGVAPEDDDGERAQGRGPQPRPPQSRPNAPTAPKSLPEDAKLKDLIKDSCVKLRQKFAAIDAEAIFVEVLGSHGYSNESEIPANRDIATRVVNDLKVRLSDLERA